MARFKCGLTHPEIGPRGVVGWCSEDTESIAMMCDGFSRGLTCNGGVIVLTVLDRVTGSSLTIQRRSCHGFAAMVRASLGGLDAPEVPEAMAQDALMHILGGSILTRGGLEPIRVKEA